jgi:hypothetical protein
MARKTKRKTTRKQREALAKVLAGFSLVPPAINHDAVEAELKACEPTYSRDEVEHMIDQDRVQSFMVFVRAMPDTFHGQVFGTADQARSIARELEKLGF